MLRRQCHWNQNLLHDSEKEKSWMSWIKRTNEASCHYWNKGGKKWGCINFGTPIPHILVCIMQKMSITVEQFSMSMQNLIAIHHKTKHKSVVKEIHFLSSRQIKPFHPSAFPLYATDWLNLWSAGYQHL